MRTREFVRGRGPLCNRLGEVPVGTLLEILLKMPEVITGEPTIEWLSSGHVVRVEPIDSTRGKLGVGVQFDCFQVSRGIEVKSN
jgi:hypothetical protein